MFKMLREEQIWECPFCKKMTVQVVYFPRTARPVKTSWGGSRPWMQVSREVVIIQSGCEYKILSIDREGSPLWSELDFPLRQKGKRESLIHIILDRSEIRVGPTCQLCGPKGILRAVSKWAREKIRQ